MKVTILLFAALRETAGRREFSLELPAGSLARDAIAELERVAGAPFATMSFMTAVNRRYVLRTEPLEDGDEVALIPPVSGGAGAAGAPPEPEIYAAVVADAIDPAALTAKVMSPAYGAGLTFIGAVREHSGGRRVVGLEYEAFEPMATSVMRWIVKRARREINFGAVAIAHRVGALAVGEIAVAVAVSAAHRRDALRAVETIMDELKTIAPIWKKERFADGEAAWVGAPASASNAPSAG